MTERDRLIEKYLAGNLTPDEQGLILSLTDSDAAFKLKLEEAVNQKALLYCALQPAPSEERLFRNVRKRCRPKRKILPAVLLSSAALGMICFIAFHYLSAGVSGVLKVAGESFLNGELIDKDQNVNFMPGDIIRCDKGRLSLLYSDGTRVQLTPGSEVKITGKWRKQIHLLQGKLTAEITRQPFAREMHFHTPHSLSEILGTEISLTTAKSGSLLSVSKGQVSFFNRSLSKSTTVAAGEYALTDGSSLQRRKSTEPLYRSPRLGEKRRTVDIGIALYGSRQLWLVVQNGGDTNRFDHTAWVQPRTEELLLRRIKPVYAKVGSHELKNLKTATVNQTVYRNLLLAHSTSIIHYKLPQGASRFQAQGVLLDSAFIKNDISPEMFFEVYIEMDPALEQQLKEKKPFH